MPLNRTLPFSISLSKDLAEAADNLRRSTVEVQAATHGKGSGVVWRSDGLIVTNAHVATSPELSVRVFDGRTFPAHLLYREPAFDLAFLQIHASALRAIETRDPTSLRAGELLLAVGNPFGATGALNAGLVSRVPKAGETLMRADIRLAPGNSGGPLADAEGRVVGVNSMIVDGFGVAVTSTSVLRLLSSDGSRDTGKRAQAAGRGVSQRNTRKEVA